MYLIHASVRAIDREQSVAETECLINVGIEDRRVRCSALLIIYVFPEKRRLELSRLEIVRAHIVFARGKPLKVRPSKLSECAAF